jgi:hypothetical protein
MTERETTAPKPPLAVLLGSGVHRSVLLHRAAALGLPDTEALSREAWRRGCRYYAPPGLPPGRSSLAEGLRDEELAIALLHPSLPADPQRIRLGAAMLAAPGNSARRVARLAVCERAERIVVEIVSAGLRYEPEVPYWRELLALLPPVPPVPEGVLPHHTRFVALTGRRGPHLPPGSHARWIRPSAPAA